MPPRPTAQVSFPSPVPPKTSRSLEGGSSDVLLMEIVKNYRKTIESPWENGKTIGKTLGKWENHRKNPQEYGKITGTSKENRRKKTLHRPGNVFILE